MATRSLTPSRSRAVEPFRPASPLLSFYRQANRLFEDVFREFDDTRDALGGILAPSIDVVQDEQEVRITAELPGVREDDIDVSVDGDVLTLRAEKRVEREDGNDRRHVSERAYGTFQRSLRLPQAVDPSEVKAHFDHGVLTVCLPRTEEGDGRHRIAIESGPPPAPEGKSQSKH
ncbi:Hsp20/alpha crystallin family protein [Sphingopyxis sp.]|uniref:Hsp20/alpha crystallin family protein n=1 Tax=Sphingopyxis sp. TaxID=1908224 RepID=UPI002B49B732|nr:Hsp20/alpha crystallin family protein [Sphingopyxis sp.]HJS11366.1 Hsp20/alpha crystallin family protein [Sphingopyxis sp.]